MSGQVTLKTCLRCDWAGDTKDSACPNCGVPLYASVTPPSASAAALAANDRAERTSEAMGTERPGPDARLPGRSTTRSVGVFAVVVLALVIGAWLSSQDGRSPQARSTGPAVDQATGGDLLTTAPSSTPTGGGPVRFPRVGRQRLRVGGIPFTIRVRTSGWGGFAERDSLVGPSTMVSINKSIVGPQGAEAIIFWSTFPDGAIAQPCGTLLDRVVGPTAADLAAAVATAPGTELVVEPSDVTVGGRTAKYVELRVRGRRDCAPGFFYTWRDVSMGPLWPWTPPRTTIRVWIVDVDGKLLFLEAETTAQASLDLEREIREIVRSIRIEA